MANDIHRRLERHVDQNILEELRRYPPGRPDKRPLASGRVASARLASARGASSSAAVPGVPTDEGSEENFTSSLIQRLVRSETLSR
eukprot:1182436-Prorocentrum_minimum.AAC.5